MAHNSAQWHTGYNAHTAGHPFPTDGTESARTGWNAAAKDAAEFPEQHTAHAATLTTPPRRSTPIRLSPNSVRVFEVGDLFAYHDTAWTVANITPDPVDGEIITLAATTATGHPKAATCIAARLNHLAAHRLAEHTAARTGHTATETGPTTRSERGQYRRLDRSTWRYPDGTETTGTDGTWSAGPDDTTTGTVDHDGTRCGWCYLGASHTPAEHARKIAEHNPARTAYDNAYHAYH